MLCVWLQLIDGRHCLLTVKTHSTRTDLSVFSRTVVRCQLFCSCCTQPIFCPYVCLSICCNCSSICNTLLLNAAGHRLHWCFQSRSFKFDEGQTVRTFKLFWRLYTYSSEHGIFQPVPAMPPHLPKQIRRALESLHLINTAGDELPCMPL